MFREGVDGAAPTPKPERGDDQHRPRELAWITGDLLDETRSVWSRYLGRPVPEEEAVEMLLNVKRLAEALHDASGI